MDQPSAALLAIDERYLVRDLHTLLSHYGESPPQAIAKELGYIHPHYRKFIEAAPFVALATCGPGGLDCTPRGDMPGFVHVVDEHTVMMPDRRGNNRVDSLRNLVVDPRLALLFLIPGVGEAMRINGRGVISVDPGLLERFSVDDKPPRSVLIVTVDAIYYQCTKALLRSKLWDPATQIPRSRLPSTGTMLAAISKGAIDGTAYDQELPARARAQMY